VNTINEKYREVKNCFIFIPSNLRQLEYMFFIVKNVSENSKGLQRNRVQLGCDVLLSSFTILKRLSFDGSFHFRKEKKTFASGRSGE
jgi:hypothetical protein